MTVADNTSRNQYTATSGQTVFAYTFEIVDKGDIVVLKNGTTLSEGADYTVSNVGNDSGGNVTLTVGATTGDILTLYRDMPYARTQNYTNSGDFLASEVNSDFDELWLASEQTNRSFEQSVRKPITDSDSISMELPQASSRANKLLGFDATGAVSTSLVTGDAQTIAGIAADIETLAHIQDGTVATDAITNVNTIRTDVTAVSGVASDVTAVAGNTANINTVATDLTGADDIGAVAGSITNVNTVAGSIANVNSVAGNATNINTVATDLAGADDIGTVAGSISSVNTVAPDINHVVTVSGDLAGADNIGTVATNISNVNAVGGISSDVTTVAGISTEVTAVSSNSTNINTVGTNITNVNNVGSNIANVNTVAGLETEINAVVADAADIGVVGANITSVNTVSSNINSVNAVYNNMADVNNAAANATAAAASAADANTSAGAAATSANAASTSASNASSSESAALTSANNASQSAATASLSASAAATSATNASSSAANAATSESNADDSETAAAISASNASSSASTASNNAIAAASSATSASNSASQAASSASAAATSATNSETAADTWNSYYSTYLGASATAPSFDLLGQPLQNGALYFNTTNNTMYVFNGSIWIAAESTINIVSVPTQLAADLTTNGNDIIFGDNDKAKFGAGSDLQIFHDGTHSYIRDSGTGNLNIQAQNFTVSNGHPDYEYYINAQSNGYLKLYYNGSEKLATTSTGIDVTGTVVSNGLTLENNAEYLKVTNSSGSSTRAFGVNSANNLYIGGIDADIGPILFVDNGATLATLGPTGLDVTGTVTADGLTVDGISSTTDYFSLGNTYNRIADKDNSGAFGGGYNFYMDASTPKHDSVGPLAGYRYTAGGQIRFYASPSSAAGTTGIERVRIENDGDISFYEDTGTTAKFFWDASTERLGLGTTSPAGSLQVSGDASNQFIIGQNTLSTGGSSRLQLVNASDTTNAPGTSTGFQIINNGNDGAVNILNYKVSPLALWTSGIERVRIDSAGNVGIGTQTVTNSTGYQRTSINGSNGGILEIKSSDTPVARFLATGGSAQLATLTAIPLLFNTNGLERMRIDANGNVLVGKTTENTSQSDGVEARADGRLYSTTNGTTVAKFNRRTSDGAVVDFRKDNTVVGSIGVNSSNAYFASSEFGIKPTSVGLVSTDISGVAQNGAEDLGGSSFRWRDLYLSGGISFNPNAAANKLDDYEEGTWSPEIADAITGGNTGTATTANGQYVKVGNLVTVDVFLSNISTTGMTAGNNLFVRNLPFNSQGNTYALGAVEATQTTFSGNLSARVNGNSTYFRLVESASGASSSIITVSDLTSGTADIFVTVSYQTS